MYRTYCYMQFTSGRFRSSQSHRAVGRHEDTVMLNAFNSVCDWLLKVFMQEQTIYIG